MRQDTCLIATEGANIEAMEYIYDQLPTSVRHRLQNISENLCLQCLNDHCPNPYSEDAWHYTIDKFLSGALNEHDPRTVQDPRRFFAQEELRRIYGDPNRTPAYFYDPIQRSSRGFDYPSGRGVLAGMDQRISREYNDAIRIIDEATSRIAQTMIIPKWFFDETP